jgi:hypothetical protein
MSTTNEGNRSSDRSIAFDVVIPSDAVPVRDAENFAVPAKRDPGKRSDGAGAEGAMKTVGNITSESFVASVSVNQSVASWIKVRKCPESATPREAVCAEAKCPSLAAKTTDGVWASEAEYSVEKAGKSDLQKTIEYKAADFCNPPESRGSAEITAPSVLENPFELFANCDPGKPTESGSRPLKNRADGAIKSD